MPSRNPIGAARLFYGVSGCRDGKSWHRLICVQFREHLLLLLVIVALGLPCNATRTVVDELGRKVKIPDHPHRIVCLAPSVADSVYGIGAGDDVIAVSDYTKYPPEAQKKPSIGSLITPSLEAIVALHPDLVIGTGTLNSARARIQELGVPVFMIDPHGMEGIYKSILTLGDVLGRKRSASAVVDRLRQRLDAVKASIRGKPVVQVLMLIWPEPVTTIGKNTFIAEAISAAGGRSATDHLENEWPVITFESLLALNPSHLLLVRGAKMSFDDLSKRPEWMHLSAVRKHKVFYTDDRLYSPSPVAIEAIEDLAKQFHP